MPFISLYKFYYFTKDKTEETNIKQPIVSSIFENVLNLYYFQYYT